MNKILAFLILAIATLSQSHASLVFTIDNYTTDELSFTFSGMFDTDTIGDSAGWLAIKNDWSNSGGIHTELYSSTPTITNNTISIGGLTPQTYLQNSTYAWNDSVFFANPFGTNNSFTAGTTVTGSMTLFGIGAFDPADAATLELVSGFVRPFDIGLGDDWARLEASAQVSAVPVPAAAWLFGSALLGFFGFSRRKANA